MLRAIDLLTGSSLGHGQNRGRQPARRIFGVPSTWIAPVGMVAVGMCCLLPRMGTAKVNWVMSPEQIAKVANGTLVDSVSTNDVGSKFNFVTPGGTAAASYKLFKYSNTASLADVSALLRQHGIADKKIGPLANSLLQGLKSRPGKALVIGVGVGAATAVVLEMMEEGEGTGTTTADDRNSIFWVVVVGAGLLAIVVYLILRHKGILS